MSLNSLESKYDRLQRILRDLKSVAVAFSAGVDSTLVLKVAIDTLSADNVVAVTGKSDSLAHAEFDETRRLAVTLGVERTVAWICGLKHIRETIPFPRMMGKFYP